MFVLKKAKDLSPYQFLEYVDGIGMREDYTPEWKNVHTWVQWCAGTYEGISGYWFYVVEDDKIIGDITLYNLDRPTKTCEIGGGVLPDWKYKKYVRPATQQVIDLAPSLGFTFLYADLPFVGKKKSINLLTKLGFNAYACMDSLRMCKDLR